MKLVIVESPTKAKTISKFLGKGFTVKSSFGHVRDLPEGALGVDPEHNFEPTYVVSPEKKRTVTELKRSAKGAEEILFATDTDREGEAISWHLASLLGVDEHKARRIVFHEITKRAIEEALKHPRPIDIHLVDAQQARRILDRLVGYELSPFLWKKVRRGLSAGRVQSVALRLIVEREREVRAFKPQEYWSIHGTFKRAEDVFEGMLFAWDGKKLEKLSIQTDKDAQRIVKACAKKTWRVSHLERKEARRNPLPPFTTSTLQQDAFKRFGFSSKYTMRLAQELYEGIEVGGESPEGLITYMRTDAVNLADEFVHEARAYIKDALGEKYCAPKPRTYTAKSKLAQEAHEAIRPTSAARTPDRVQTHLTPQQWKLYDLIWRRALATQMSEAVFEQSAIDIEPEHDPTARFRATGIIVRFDGYLKVYPSATKEVLLPTLTQDEALTLTKIEPKQHFTEPPARFTDATLVKILEEHGIGRPSTYAPTIATIEDRGYVTRDEKKHFMPSEIGEVVSDVLTKHFPDIVDYQFTARVEDDLDEIAQGKKEWEPIIRAFYTPFKTNLEEKYTEVKRKDIMTQETDEVCEKCGKPMVIRLGRYGKFMACSGYPACKNTKPLSPALGGAGGEAPRTPEPTNEVCEKCGSPMVRRQGKYGPFLSCSTFPTCKNIVSIEEKTGVRCPACSEGELVARRSKRGKPFYSCNRYPKCTFALWSRPTGEKCPACGSLMVQQKQGTRCSNKTCGEKQINPTLRQDRSGQTECRRFDGRVF